MAFSVLATFCSVGLESLCPKGARLPSGKAHIKLVLSVLRAQTSLLTWTRHTIAPTVEKEFTVLAGVVGPRHRAEIRLQLSKGTKRTVSFQWLRQGAS